MRSSAAGDEPVAGPGAAPVAVDDPGFAQDLSGDGSRRRRGLADGGEPAGDDAPPGPLAALVALDEPGLPGNRRWKPAIRGPGR
jgi:hypothetical protein